MNYKLAEKLKEAGWKSLQEVDDYSLEYEANEILLEELIKKCGDFGGTIKILVNPDGYTTAIVDGEAEEYGKTSKIAEEATIY